MEFVRGPTLRQVLADGTVTVKQAVDFAIQIADALAAAHAGGVVHRDLKPENIMLTPEGLIKVLDFGLAKRGTLTNPDPTREGVAGETLTHAGAILGTVGYMSPEQAAGGSAEHTADQFSFGAILYEMLAGRRAFERATDVETLYAIIREHPAPIRGFSPEVPASLQEVVDRCLAKESITRYSNMQELAARLRDIRDHWDRAETLTTPIPDVAPSDERRLTRRHAIWLGGAVSLTAIAGLGFWRLWPFNSGIRSLAVLPFENALNDADAEFLCYALTNSLIRKMSAFSALTVKRGSVSESQGRVIDLRAAGRQLQVDAIVRGSVSRRSGKLYVEAELVDVASGAVVWAERYDRDEADMALIQDEIASAIIDNGIRLKLTVDDRRQLARHSTNDPEAYKLYMRATYLHTKENEDDYLTARQLLQQAVTRDETFAVAYDQLAFNYATAVVDGYESPSSNWPLVTKYARKALDLDPAIIEAHSGLAAEAFFYKWDWELAEEEFQIALQSPDNPNAGYAIALWAVGRPHDAVRIVRRDLSRNPSSLDLRLREADLLHHLGQTESAEDLYTDIIRDEPADSRGYYGLAEVRRTQQRYDEAIDQLRRSLEMPSGSLPLDTSSASLLRTAKGAEGYRQVERILAQLELDNLESRAAQAAYVSPLDFARVYARLGNKDQALHYLNEAFAERSPGLLFLKVDQAWDSIRSDPGFEKAVRRVGLP
jgi:serine/threonine-protein kinase